MKKKLILSTLVLAFAVAAPTFAETSTVETDTVATSQQKHKRNESSIAKVTEISDTTITLLKSAMPEKDETTPPEKPAVSEDATAEKPERPTSDDGTELTRAGKQKPTSEDGTELTKPERPISEDGTQLTKPERPTSEDGTELTRGGKRGNFENLTDEEKAALEAEMGEKATLKEDRFANIEFTEEVTLDLSDISIYSFDKDSKEKVELSVSDLAADDIVTLVTDPTTSEITGIFVGK